LPIVLGGLAAGVSDDAGLRGITAIGNDGREAVAIVESFASTRVVRRAV
jgi:hypothetical protein